MLERYADIGSIRQAAASAAAEWQSLVAAFGSTAGADPKAAAQMGADLLRARISATGILLGEIGKALEAGASRDVLKPALGIVTFELDRLSRGEIRPSLYMATVAQALACACQGAPRPPGAFFLPVIPVMPPAVGQENTAEAFAQAVETHRHDYEAALIRYAHGDRGALQAMQSALVAIENRNPVAEYRVVIALASAFVSALEDGLVPFGDETKHLFSRIDAVLRSAAKNAPVPDQCIASRLAYVLAQVPASHKRSAFLQERLGLKSLLSEEAPAIHEFPPPDIFDTVFQSVVDEFEHYLADENDGQSVVKAVDKLRIVCSVNTDALRMVAALQNLMSAVAAKRIARTPEIVDYLSQFMARTLDAISSRDAGELEKIAQEETEVAGQILRDGSLSMVIRDATSPSMIDFFREAAIDARAALAIVDGPEANPDAEAIARVCGLLERIEAVLKMCYVPDGAALIQCLRQKICEQPEAKLYVPALDSLARYLDTIGGDPDTALALLKEIRERHLQPKSKAASEDLPSDPEIFEIFLEEAREVVADIKEAVGQGSKAITDKESAASARRSFHTLKGSARMAGLTHLGQVMFGAENVFNVWLSHSLPYPVELSQFADRWADFALSVCETIAKKGRCDVDEEVINDDCSRLLALAEEAAQRTAEQQVLALAKLPQVQPAAPLPVSSEMVDSAAALAPVEASVEALISVPQEEAPAEPPAADSAVNLEEPALELALPDTVPVPGGMVPEEPVADGAQPMELPAGEQFDPDLLALYFTESAELLAKLREQTLVARGGLASFELIRAAHGLAGMSRTVGLPEIAEVALPIEAWASRLNESRHRPPARDIDAVLAAADEIEGCIQSIKAGVRRIPDPTLVAGLASVCEAVLQDQEAVQQDQPSLAAVPAVDLAPPVSAAAPIMAPEISRSKTDEEIDSLVLREFAEEATELLQALDDELDSDTPSIPQINRFLHTFKGGARLCGAMGLGDVLHGLENLTARAVAAGEEKKLLAEVERGLDEARMMLSVLLTPEEAEAPAPAGENTIAEGSAASAQDASEALQIQIGEEDENVVFRVTSGQIAELTGQLDDMRVARDMLTQQLRDAEDAAENIAHPVRRIEEIAAQVQIEAETRMDAGAASAGGKFDALEFDRFTALHELTRKLSEAVHDVLAVSEGLSGSLSRADRALMQSRSAAEAFAVRLAGISRGPLDVLEARLKAAVRSAAVTLDKDCHVELLPSKVRIERAVLDRVAPALDHLVRNSVAHGIEESEMRRSLGKPEFGTITISARQRGEMAEIVVADDGGGINIEAVRRKIQERGLESRYPSQENFLEALFDPGFSTAETLTQVAGRGVGLDVVQDIVTHLGGRVRIENRPGQGVNFILTVPVSASFVSGLMLTVGQGVYLLPGASVVELAVLSGAAVRQALETGEPVLINGRSTRITWLGSLVDAGTRPAIQNYNKIVVVDGGRTGLLADDVQHMESLLTKPFAQAAAWGGSILGCAILHDGRTALIIDPARTLALMPKDRLVKNPVGEVEEMEPLVLIVDDSVTVRKVTSRLVLRHGFRVETAENGKIALDKLHEMGSRLPVAILMDIEMPVMDGFEATQQIKLNPRTGHIPVIIISSRNVDKHIDYAKSMGADHFLGKPYKDEDLLALLREYAGIAAAS